MTQVPLGLQELQDLSYLAGKDELPNENFIINGDFSVWQRGTNLSDIGYLADRWASNVLTGSGIQQDRGTLTDGQSQVVGYDAKYFLSISCDELTEIYTNQSIEGCGVLAGKTVTFSGWFSGTGNVRATCIQVFGAGGATTETEVLPSQPLTAGFSKVEFTFDVLSMEGKTEDENSFTMIRFYRSSGIAGNLAITKAKLELGSVATPFIPDDPATNLAKCQRYCQALPTDTVLVGQNFSTTLCGVVRDITEMRVTPAVGGTWTATVSDAAGGPLSAAFSTSNSTKSALYLLMNVGTGLTAGDATVMKVITGTILLDAEL